MPDPSTPTRPLPRLLHRARDSALAVASLDRIELVTAMTLILLLLYSGRSWSVQLPMALLGGAGLLFAPLRRSGVFWLVVTTVMAVGTVRSWYDADNHKYVISYWCLSLALAFLAARFASADGSEANDSTVGPWPGEPERSLAISARWVIALCFLLATIYKLRSPEFLDGSFFHHAFVTDRRLQKVAELFGWLLPGVGEANRRATEAVVGFGGPVETIELQSSAAVARASLIMAWATVAIEALVTLVFLSPDRSWPARFRLPLLLLFVLATYVLAPVVGFGWVLLILGLVLAPRSGYLPAAYVAAFLILPFYRMPWQNWIHIFR